MSVNQQESILQDLLELQRNPSLTSGLEHRCFDLDYLDLDLEPAVMISQKIATTAHSLSLSLCPSLASISARALLLYPLHDRHMSRIVQNALNLVLGVYYTAQVTQVRCRCAFALSLSTTLCAPDLYPMFRYVERIAESLGLLVDNWLNMGHMMILSFFLDRDADVVDRCSVRAHRVTSLMKDDIFGSMPTRLLLCTASLMAVTDGKNVIYTSKNENKEPICVLNAFRDTIDIGNGIAAIDSASSLLKTDQNGHTRTGILGCKCVDSEKGEFGVSLTCNVALFPAFFDPPQQLQTSPCYSSGAQQVVCSPAVICECLCNRCAFPPRFSTSRSRVALARHPTIMAPTANAWPIHANATLWTLSCM